MWTLIAYVGGIFVGFVVARILPRGIMTRKFWYTGPCNTCRDNRYVAQSQFNCGYARCVECKQDEEY